ncbi:HAD-superfamily hydrolase, subfamily IA, variant 1 family protein [Sulfitobacter noctilucae]|uniref:HAD family hydrolase n=1 Tax=Sulfitobacter noctilucae TaxID=1342302 RepID=UPI0004695104|nr:HAD family hydrolase [Sulfitobacter noctilucae]KIN61611.1 HAD-superfamily hydrolase, subfamily IA, variant 1 family protein [Sulfitobacter noctilucae]
MNGIKGIIFDKDGTLFDFKRTWGAWAHACLLRLCDGDVQRATVAGRAIAFDFEKSVFAPTSVVIAGTPDEVTQALHGQFPHMSPASLTQLLNEEAEKAPQQTVVPLVPLLDELRRRGLALGVATNDAEKPAQAHLDQAGVSALFDFIAGYDSGFGGKPQPGQLLAFAEAQGLDPASCVMVGDSTHDLRAGAAAGMTSVAVLTGLAQHSDLAPFADTVLPDIGHLPAWLDTRTG